MGKKVLLFVIDALGETDVRRKLADAEVPQLAELIRDTGQAIRCLSIFPSITPAATCSIITGAYPREHGIQGAFWFDKDQGEIAYFGDDLRLIRKEGFKRYLIDFGDRLNTERLRAKTLFQALQTQGITTGCVNFMWYHGNQLHERSTPWLLRLIADQLSKDVYGPDVLKLGDFVNSWPDSMKQVPSLPGGAFHRFGFTDEVSMGAIQAMLQQDCLPEFTLAYLPRNDDLAHQIGPGDASDDVLERFDKFLGELAATAGGWQQLKKDYVVLIVGDHAQSYLVEDQEQREIKLDELLDGVTPGNADGDPGDAKRCFCANMRTAAIYQLNGDQTRCTKISDLLLRDPRIDQVIWQDVRASAGRFQVRSERGQFSFATASDDDTKAVSDALGNRWSIEGELAVLDLKLQDGGIIDGAYPNALERIANAYIPEEDAPLWVTAKAGFEFSSSDAHVNARGSHGSLTAEDSNSCFITSQVGAGLPEPMRITDVWTVCMALLTGPDS